MCITTKNITLFKCISYFTRNIFNKILGYDKQNLFCKLWQNNLIRPLNPKNFTVIIEHKHEHEQTFDKMFPN